MWKKDIKIIFEISKNVVTILTIAVFLWENIN